MVSPLWRQNSPVAQAQWPRGTDPVSSVELLQICDLLLIFGLRAIDFMVLYIVYIIVPVDDTTIGSETTELLNSSTSCLLRSP